MASVPDTEGGSALLRGVLRVVAAGEGAQVGGGAAGI